VSTCSFSMSLFCPPYFPSAKFAHSALCLALGASVFDSSFVLESLLITFEEETERGTERERGEGGGKEEREIRARFWSALYLNSCLPTYDSSCAAGEDWRAGKGMVLQADSLRPAPAVHTGNSDSD
jgi:hypothetical protein